MIKYLGSKRKLIPHIMRAVELFPNAKTVMDVFSGTSRVGHALKKKGYRVIANDYATFAATLARCYVQADAEEWLEDAKKLIEELNRIPGRYGYFTETFCVKSRYFHPKNGERIDAIREAIAAKNLDPELEAILLTSLMEAADRVDCTTGKQCSYLKRMTKHALRDLELVVPEVLPRPKNGKCEAVQLDARLFVSHYEADVAYLDPPYNNLPYLSSYHIWETLVRWDYPPTKGVMCKRIDANDTRSDFNSKVRYREALEDLLKNIKASAVIVSMSDEAFLNPEQMVELLKSIYPEHNIAVASIEHRRYASSKHRKSGRRRVEEKLYVVSRDFDPDFEDAYERHFVSDHLDCELGNKRTSEPVRRHCQVPFWGDDTESFL